MILATVCVLAGGCASAPSTEPIAEAPNVAPTTRPASSHPLEFDAAEIRPMYTELLAIDLPTVVQLATVRNVDIRRARESVKAARGRYQSAVGAMFPALAPTAMFERFDGGFLNTDGRIFQVGASVFQPSLALQWVLNPGAVVYDIIAAKKRLHASEHTERSVVIETLRQASIGFYDLILTQARIAAAQQGVAEATELLRISRLRIKTGTGVPADELRAEARLAERRQDRVLSLNALYEASVALAVMLHLDAAVTLVPNHKTLSTVHLVDENLSIEEILGIAIAHRPDLKSVRTLVDAYAARKGATWWSGFGPEVALEYQYGGITGHAHNVVPAEGVPGNLIVNPVSPTGSFSANPLADGIIREGIGRTSRQLDHRRDRTYTFRDQRYGRAAVGWRLTVSAFGELKTAEARQQQALIDAERTLDEVRAQVVMSAQNSDTNRELLELTRQQVTSADEALRLIQANLEAGAMTTLDVLQAQDAATQARLRYADAVVSYNQSQVNLLAALGLLDEAALHDPTNRGRPTDPDL